MFFKHKDTNDTFRFRLFRGLLLVLTSEAGNQWFHGIPTFPKDEIGGEIVPRDTVRVGLVIRHVTSQ